MQLKVGHIVYYKPENVKGFISKIDSEENEIDVYYIEWEDGKYNDEPWSLNDFEENDNIDLDYEYKQNFEKLIKE